jgi:hypothetical protein
MFNHKKLGKNHYYESAKNRALDGITQGILTDGMAQYS